MTAIDCDGSNLTGKVAVAFSDFDTTRPGTDSVTYTVTATKGQTTIKMITVKVCENGPRSQAITDRLELILQDKMSLFYCGLGGDGCCKIK